MQETEQIDVTLWCQYCGETTVTVDPATGYQCAKCGAYGIEARAVVRKQEKPGEESK